MISPKRWHGSFLNSGGSGSLCISSRNWSRRACISRRSRSSIASPDVPHQGANAPSSVGFHTHYLLCREPHMLQRKHSAGTEPTLSSAVRVTRLAGYSRASLLHIPHCAVFVARRRGNAIRSSAAVARTGDARWPDGALISEATGCSTSAQSRQTPQRALLTRWRSCSASSPGYETNSSQ